MKWDSKLQLCIQKYVNLSAVAICLQLFVARPKYGSLSRNIQGELEAALLFQCSLLTEVPALQLLIARCSSSIHNREQRPSLHNYLLSLTDTDTNREHLPIAEIANREWIHLWERQLSSLIHIAWEVHVCTPNKLYLFPFNIPTSQRSTTSLSPHLLGCLVRDLNYGPWPVTLHMGHCTKYLFSWRALDIERNVIAVVIDLSRQS